MPQSIFYEKNIEKSGEVITPIHNITPTDLIKFVPESVIEEVSPLLDKIFMNESNGDYLTFEIPNIIQTSRGFHEDVSDLNGIAIPCIYYDYMQKKWNTNNNINILHAMIQNNIVDMKENEHKFLRHIIENLPEKCENPGDYLYMANVFVATQERLYFKLKQIGYHEYNWLNEQIVDNCMSRFDDIIGSECKRKKPVFEQTLIDYSMNDEHESIDAILKPFFEENIKFRFSARLDLVTEFSVWELKCTTKISIDHLLQVVIYAWLWRIIIEDNDNPRNIRILNIKTGEQLRLEATFDELTQIVVALLKSKYSKPVVKSDLEFTEDCNRIFL